MQWNYFVFSDSISYSQSQEMGRPSSGYLTPGSSSSTLSKNTAKNMLLAVLVQKRHKTKTSIKFVQKWMLDGIILPKLVLTHYPLQMSELYPFLLGTSIRPTFSATALPGRHGHPTSPPPPATTAPLQEASMALAVASSHRRVDCVTTRPVSRLFSSSPSTFTVSPDCDAQKRKDS